jgi:signal transduction histidine kinase
MATAAPPFLPDASVPRAGTWPRVAWQRLRSAASAHPFALDVGVAIVLFALGGLSVHLLIDVYAVADSSFRVNEGWAWSSTAVITLSIAGRRRWPLATLAISTGTYAVSVTKEASEPYAMVIAVLIALYSAGAYGRRPAATWVRLAAVCLLFGEFLYYGVIRADDTAVEGSAETMLQLFQISLNLFYFGGAWITGNFMRSRRLREAELAERAIELEAAQAEVAGKAVLDERVRIARELHDVVAHHVSVMGVQAGAARRVLAQDPDRAAEALSSVETSSREAVAELHRLLGFLRSDDEPEPAGPQPTLRQLERLIEQTRSAGLTVELRVEGIPRSVPPGVDLSAYRVAQEAITNALKHAGPRARVDVTLTYRSDAVEVRVIDSGSLFRPSVPAAGRGRGNGLLGMRERVGLHGGTFEAGRRPNGGFEVHAVFPTAGA